MIAISRETTGPKRFTLADTTWQADLFTWPTLAGTVPDNERAKVEKQLETVAAGKSPRKSPSRPFVKGASIGFGSYSQNVRQAYIAHMGREPRTIEKWGELL